MTGDSGDSVVRQTVLALMRSEAQGYPVRWCDERTSRGDFDGREYTLEFFNVPAEQWRALRRDLRAVKKVVEAVLDHPLVLRFHTPEATVEHYRPAVEEASRVENAVIQGPLVLRAYGRLNGPFNAAIEPGISVSLRRAA